MNSPPRPPRGTAIPRGKIDPFPGFPAGSGGSYITDGHLYISNPALRPGSSELPVAVAFDLLGIQKHFFSANAPELRNSSGLPATFIDRREIQKVEIATYRIADFFPKFFLVIAATLTLKSLS